MTIKQNGNTIWTGDQKRLFRKNADKRIQAQKEIMEAVSKL